MSLKKIIIMYILAIVAQITLLNLIVVFQVAPNLVLCLTIVLVFLYKDGYKCVLIGVISQLVLDFAGSPVVGVGALSIFLTGVVVVIIRAYLNVEKLAPLLVTGIISVTVYNMIYFPIMTLVTNFMGMGYLLSKLGISLIYDSITISIMFFFMIKKVQEHNSRYGI